MWFRYFHIPYVLAFIRPCYGYFVKHSYSQIQNDYFKYRSSYRRNFKKSKGYTNYVEDHHVIPKQWRHHELLQNINFDVHCSDNLYIMPNNDAIKRFHLHPDTLIHQGGHRKYNYYVKEQLDYIQGLNKDAQEYEFWLLLHHLKSNMKYNKDGIPWK